MTTAKDTAEQAAVAAAADDGEYSLDGDDEETALATGEEGGTPVIAPVYSDDSDEEGYAVSYPKLRLMQALSPTVQEGLARAGEFRVDGIDEIPDPLIVVPMFRTKFRVRRADKKEDPLETILCASSDAVTGEGDPGGNCSTCPFAKARTCNLVNSFVLYIPGLDTVAQMDFQRGGLSTARTINTFIRQKKFGNFGLTLRSKDSHQRNNPDNKFKVVDARLVFPLPDDVVLPELDAA